MTIADMKVGTNDLLGDNIRAIYGFKPPEYAVYSTVKRLSVQFADNPVQANEQRKGLCPLNPIRGEINGLIDGWRLRYESTGLPQKAARYDRRVADALVLALEADVDSAATLLKEIKQDIIDDRTSWARLEYLVSSLAMGLLLVCVCAILATGDSVDLLRAAAAGALGAFFSIALNIRSRTILPDLRRVSNLTDAGLRIVIGFIAASVLMALVKSNAVTVGLGDATVAKAPPWLFALLMGFLGGFSERLVPDLLAKAGTTTQNPSPSPLPPVPAEVAGRVAAAGPAATSDKSITSATDGQDEQDKDPAPQDAAIDNCICDIDHTDAEITHDNELPPATGGVESAEGGRTP